MSLQQIESYDVLMDVLGAAGLEDIVAADLAEILIDDLATELGTEIYSNDQSDKDYVELVIRIPK